MNTAFLGVNREREHAMNAIRRTGVKPAETWALLPINVNAKREQWCEQSKTRYALGMNTTRKTSMVSMGSVFTVVRAKRAFFGLFLGLSDDPKIDPEMVAR